MEGGLYTVVLFFDHNDQLLREKIIDRLSQIDPTASERLSNIPSNRIIVKKNATLKTAKRLAELLQQTGTTCNIHRQKGTRNRSKSNATAPPAFNKRAPEWIVCPKCHCKQPPVNECRTCGVIIEKARPPREIELPKTFVAPRQPESPLGNITIERVKQRFATAFRALIRLHPIDTEKFQNWRQRLVDRMLSCVVVIIIAAALQICLLHLFKLLWFIYSASPVGEYYIANFPEKAAAIQNVVNVNLLLLCRDSMLVVICISLLISVAAQFVHLIRYYFDPMGFVGKFVIWFAPVTALAAWKIQWIYQFPYYPPVICLALAPTICTLAAFVQLARDTMPEIGMVWNAVTKAGQRDAAPVWVNIKRIISSWINSTS